MSSGEIPARPVVPPALVLVAAVLAMSWSGPLVRFTTAPALAVAAWRLSLSVLFIGVLMVVRRRRASMGLNGRRAALMGAAGLLLAAHFWSWIESLRHTTVASSVVLVSMQPFFVGLLSTWLLRERPTPRQWAAIGMAVAGAAVIGWGDFAIGGSAVFGDMLALAGALFGAGYFAIGRALREHIELDAYIFVVYGVAAVALIGAVAVLPDVAMGGYATRDWLVFIALAAGPMLIGHTGINYALRYVPAYVANLVVLGEPVGATVIAWALPAIGERPGPQVVAGGALVLAGILAGTRRRGSAGTAMRSADRAME